MRTYTIKKDGYPLGQARGIHNAVKRIAGQLDLFKHKEKSRWYDNGGIPACQVIDQGLEITYTIEETTN